MRVLFLCHRIPYPPDKGDKIRAFHQLRAILPVVSTSRPVQGLATPVAELVETGDSPKEMAAKVIKLLRDPELASTIGLEGRRRVAAECDWDRVLQQLLKVLESPATSPSLDSLAPSLSPAAGRAS